MTQRMAEQVVTCLQSQSPEAAAQIQACMQQDVPGLTEGQTTANLATALMQKDEQYLHRWLEINKRLSETPTAAACAIPP